MSNAPLILLAAGGTGGHLFPAEALGGALMKRGFRVRLVTDARALRYSGLFTRDTIDVVPSETVRSRNPFSLARTGFTLAAGMAVAVYLLRKLKPAAVVGFGGYPTLPPLVAARLLGIPGIVHEANAVLGRANRFLARRVSQSQPRCRVCSTGSRACVENHDRRHADAPGDRCRGGREICRADAAGPFRLLVTGGSQGARVMADIVPGAIGKLEPSLWSRLVLTQQVREEDWRGFAQSMTGSRSTRSLRRFSPICRRGSPPTI